MWARHDGGTERGRDGARPWGQRLMKPHALSCAALALLGTATAGEAAPRTHRLEPSPATVAYGHYWSETKPALRSAAAKIR